MTDAETKATMVRRALKLSYPDTSFSVRVARGTSVSAIDVCWTDGPPRAEVTHVLSDLQSYHPCGTFLRMERLAWAAQ